jgi:hypothetical protein
MASSVRRRFESDNLNVMLNNFFLNGWIFLK